MVYTDLNTDVDVGASGHLIEMGPFKALVDCGLHPKRMGLDALPDISKITPETLDFIAVTHAHLDHCGALPVVARNQNHAHILAAEENSDLLARMLRNSRSVMVKQREEFDVKEYPLFDSQSIDALKSKTTPMPFHHEKQFEINGERIGVTFTPAGHIPGASSVMFEYKRRKILFSGDISFHSTGILRGATPPEGRVDTLVVETTRGSYSRPEGVSYDSEVARLVTSISLVLRGGGSVLIPAFALGRMQEILFILQRAKQQKAIPDVPVFAGGLGLDIAEHFIKGAKRSSTFFFGKQHMEGVKPLRGEIVPGKDFETRGIYVLGSGMMVEHTPSYLAAAAMMDNRANAIFFVGYADRDTPAARLQRTPYGGQFSFKDLFFVGNVNCRVDKFDLTSHADREEILEFIMRKDPRCVVLTHGSMAAREWFMDEIIDRSPKTSVIIPEPSVPVEL